MKHLLKCLILTTALINPLSASSSTSDEESSYSYKFNLVPSSGEHLSWLMKKHEKAQAVKSVRRLMKGKKSEPSLPSYVDFREISNLCPPVYDQGDLGSCTANAVAGALEIDQRKRGVSHSFTPSRLMLYYHGRYLIDQVDEDTGTSIAAAAKAIKYGYVPEEMWPYDDGPTRFKIQPGPDCYRIGLKLFNQAKVSYTYVPQEENIIKGYLSKQQPVLFGIMTYDSLSHRDVRQTGMVPVPSSGERERGGHALLMVGYDDREYVGDGLDKKPNPHYQHFIFRNSWGEKWGDGGYGYIPYKYVLNEDRAFDFWKITKTTVTEKTRSLMRRFEESDEL